MSSQLDVARLAGVSKSLVSRVVNGQSGVSTATRKKILAAMKELHYQPNAIARSLVTRRTMTIGVVLDSLCVPYFFSLIEGLQEAAAGTSYNLVFASGQDHLENKKKAVRYFAEGRADGIILYGSRLEEEPIIRDLAAGTFPFTVVENSFPRLHINNITLDNAYGSALAVDYLVSRGCKSIVHVTGGDDTKASLERSEGYFAEMRKKGIPTDPSMVIPATFEFKPSYQAVKAWLAEQSGRPLPDAFYCASDYTAYGTIAALEEAGWHVPESTMVIGFDDDLPPRDYAYKPLTTLSQPLKQMGVCAFETLIASIDQPEASPRHVLFYPELILRETTR